MAKEYEFDIDEFLLNFLLVKLYLLSKIHYSRKHSAKELKCIK